MARQLGRKSGFSGAQHVPGLLVGVLGHLAALAITEGIGQIHFSVTVVGLKQHDVGVRVGVFVVFHAQLQP